MNEQTQNRTLAERTLLRLRQLATGNGLEPAAVAILEVQEDIFTITGKMEISPLCEAEPTSYPGGIKGGERKIVASFSALQGAVDKHRQEFLENPDWIPAAVQEIKSHHSQGWGLEDAKVTLPQKSIIYAASETCPSCGGRQLLTCGQCNGQGTVICTQCQGQGRELCYYCGGRGENPQLPGQPCTTCNGTRFAPCRFCQSRGHLACPTCHGKRGTTCTTCQGTGKVSQEVTVTCGAETHFTLQATGMPSGLRRGLDRIGVASLGKGHADIIAIPPSEAEVEESQVKGRVFVLKYEVKMPYAEIRMGLGNKKAVVSVAGKRCAIMGVPPFLDIPLKPWRDKLRQAAIGQAPLHEALEARALNDILSLTVTGKGYVENVSKMYPYGLSLEVMKSVLNDMRLALNKTTLKTRAVIATLCVFICAILFCIFFSYGIESSLSMRRNKMLSFALDFSTLLLCLMISWAALNFSTRFVLRRRFPQLKIALQQIIGKTGYGMLSGIILMFIVCIFCAPTRPVWLSLMAR